MKKVSSRQPAVFAITYCENVIGDLQYTDKADLKRRLIQLADLIPDDALPGSFYICGCVKSENRCQDGCGSEKHPSIADQVFGQSQDGHTPLSDSTLSQSTPQTPACDGKQGIQHHT